MFRKAAVVLGAATVLFACGDGDEPVGGVPDGAADADAVSGPGTALGNGFEVADGSHLIGAAVPLGTTMIHDGVPVVDEGWAAHLYVSGHPREVVESYLAQAEAQGLTPSATPDAEPFAMEGEEVPPTAYARCGTTGAGAYECAASAGADDGRCLTIDLRRSDRASHVRVALSLRDDVTGYPICNGVAGVASDPDTAPPGPPEQWPEFPEPGEPLGDPWGHLSDVVVQEGSEVVSVPLDGDGCGSMAALSVMGDPVTVLDRYVDEFRRLTVEGASDYSDRMERDGVTLERRTVNEAAGGRMLSADLVTDSGGEAWLYVTGCQG